MGKVHNGLQKYAGIAATNVSLGQAGFWLVTDKTKKYIAGQGVGGPTIIYTPTCTQFSCIKNVTKTDAGFGSTGAVNCTVELLELENSLNNLGNSIEMTLSAGDVFYGPIKSVQMTGTMLDPRILVYLG